MDLSADEIRGRGAGSGSDTDDVVQKMDLDLHAHYQGLLNRATPERRERYRRRLFEAIGFDYPFSIVPCLLPGAIIDTLVATTEALLRLLMAPDYQRRVAAMPWVLPQRPIGLADCYGAIDFHLSEQGGKLIEVNFTPPGYLGFNRLAEEALFETLGLDGAEQINGNFEQCLVDAACGGDRSRRIAIAANHTAVSDYFRPHYRYVEKIFRRHGVDADLVLGNDVEIAAGSLPRWHGKYYDRVFNLVIPRLMEHQPEEFPNYIRLYHEQPERIVPNPFGWRLGSKAFLAICHRIDEEDFGLTDGDRRLIRDAALEAYRLDQFPQPEAVVECFGGLERLVLKPLDNYDTCGVHIQPTMAILRQVFTEERDDYVVQAFHPHSAHPFITGDGEVKQHLSCVRVTFIAGKVCSISARSFEHSAVDTFITPVIRL